MHIRSYKNSYGTKKTEESGRDKEKGIHAKGTKKERMGHFANEAHTQNTKSNGEASVEKDGASYREKEKNTCKATKSISQKAVARAAKKDADKERNNRA